MTYIDYWIEISITYNFIVVILCRWLPRDTQLCSCMIYVHLYNDACRHTIATLQHLHFPQRCNSAIAQWKNAKLNILQEMQGNNYIHELPAYNTIETLIWNKELQYAKLSRRLSHQYLINGNHTIYILNSYIHNYCTSSRKDKIEEIKWRFPGNSREIPGISAHIGNQRMQ